MTTAELGIVHTSSTCVRYELLVNDQRIWSCRVAPTKAGREKAQALMEAWAAWHDVEIDEGFEEVEKQPIRES